MKNQPLKPWIKGNESITPNNFFSNALPNLEYGAWISLDIAVELYKANTIDTGYLKKSWNEHHEYIEQVCLLTGIDEENGYDLDREEKWWVLQEIGEPPFGCYNIYFITIYNEHEEKLVYIGKTDSKKYLSEMEAYLIERLNPELNKKKEPLHLLENLSSVLIQNFSEENAFMKDFFV